jgi:L-threonylcarbamoyladenylate synthase
MAIIQARGASLSDDALERTIHALDSGLVVGVPSDTSYALVADVSYTGAADRMFAMKRRSRTFELPMLVSDVEQAMSLAVGVPASAERLMEKFWPGPLTIILPRHPDFVADLGSDDETVGIRCPGHSVPRQLCDEIGPLATTSANISGQPTITEAEGIVDTFGDAVHLVLDGGKCEGPGATVVDCTGEQPKLLSEGAIAWAEISAAV